jgi:hypothetical protein
MGFLDTLRRRLLGHERRQTPSSSSAPATTTTDGSSSSSSPDTPTHVPDASALAKTGAAADPIARPEAPPAQVDAHAVASGWLARFASALSARDEEALKSLFAPSAIMRDSLVFSWDLRSPPSSSSIASHILHGLETKSGGAKGAIRNLKLDESEGLAPDVMMFDQPGAVQLAFVFETEIGKGRGSARLFPRSHYASPDAAASSDTAPAPSSDKKGAGKEEEWVADSAYAMLDSITGHEERLLTPQRDPNVDHAVPWGVSDAERRKIVEDDPFVVVGEFLSHFLFSPDRCPNLFHRSSISFIHTLTISSPIVIYL